MIRADAKLTICVLSVSQLQVTEYQIRYMDMVNKYVAMLKANPGMYLGIIHVVPSFEHEGMYIIRDGHHRYCAYILAGREDVLCCIIDGE